ncbi:MAG: LITAF-like zinc ribbon domain-containing protein [Benjaminiella poitrasii]|nr:MAG: LITAF-like zinc ribbon domain-containing protein [Benjaminiella poitrasii]
MSHSVYNPHLELPPPPSLQHQQSVSIYPKLPSHTEQLPSYSAATSMSSNMPISMPMPAPHHHEQQQQQQPQQGPPTVMYYGSVAPPTVNNMPPSHQLLIQPLETLKTKSELVLCPYCRQVVYTTIDYESGLCTGLSVGGLFFLGCHSGGCLVPFLFPWTKDVIHQCPSCKQKIATFTRLEKDVRITAPLP